VPFLFRAEELPEKNPLKKKPLKKNTLKNGNDYLK